jgi:hypothetical protein
MSERVNPFATLKDTPAFTTKPKAEKPVEEAAVTRIAEENGFPSREPPRAKKPERRKARVYRTGRDHIEEAGTNTATAEHQGCGD